MRIESVLSMSGSSVRRCSHAITAPTTMPTAAPPAAATTKSRVARPPLTASPMVAATATRRAVRAVASLSRLSPSRMVTTRRGSPTLRATAVADTASGGATTAPRARQAASGSEGTTRCRTSPTAAVVNSTSPKASSAMGRALARSATSEDCRAALCSSRGRTTTSTSSGSSR